MTYAWKPEICIYHGYCLDGFGAAWAIWKRWGNACDFRPGFYGKPLPLDGIDGKNVLFVDFSASAVALESALAPVAPHPATKGPLFEIDTNRAGKVPCGECHIQPGETCDICGASYT